MNQPSFPETTLTEEQERLLGRALLGRATPDDVETLERARRENPAVATALTLLEETHLDKTVDQFLNDPHALPLPDYYRAEHLARLGQVTRKDQWKMALWSSLTLVPGWLFTLWPPEAGLGRHIGYLVIPLTILLTALILMLPWIGERQARQIAVGRLDWMHAAQNLRRFERFMQSAWPVRMKLIATLLLTGGFIAIALTGGGLLEFQTMRWWIVGLIGIGSGLAAALYGYRSVLFRLRTDSDSQ